MTTTRRDPTQGEGHVLGVIPARLASTRFPGKVLAPLAGRPLVQHAYERLSRAAQVHDVLVATDSPEVEEAVRLFGGQVVRVDEACPTGSDRTAAAVRGRAADIVVNLQADQPCIDPRDVDSAVLALKRDPGLDLTTLAFLSSERVGFDSPDVVKVVADRCGRALYFSRAGIPAGRCATGKVLFLHHVGIYCFRRAALERFASLPESDLERRESLEQLRAIENGMAVGVVVSARASVSVDRERDVAAAEEALGRQQEGPDQADRRRGGRGLP